MAFSIILLTTVIQLRLSMFLCVNACASVFRLKMTDDEVQCWLLLLSSITLSFQIVMHVCIVFHTWSELVSESWNCVEMLQHFSWNEVLFLSIVLHWFIVIVVLGTDIVDWWKEFDSLLWEWHYWSGPWTKGTYTQSSAAVVSLSECL